MTIFPKFDKRLHRIITHNFYSIGRLITMDKCYNSIVSIKNVFSSFKPESCEK